MASRALRWGLTGSSLGMICVLSGCSLLLDFDEPVDAIDGGRADSAPAADADERPDAALAANCDVLEPNESLATAAEIAPMTIEAAICPNGDLDFYSFALPANTDVTITLNFLNEPSPADLDLSLYDAGDEIIAAAMGTGTSDQIIRSQAQGNQLPEGSYRIEVSADAPTVTKDYSLTLELTPVPPPV